MTKKKDVASLVASRYWSSGKTAKRTEKSVTSRRKKGLEPQEELRHIFNVKDDD